MEDLELSLAKHLCEQDHLFFTKYFFKHRQGAKFIVNWHHRLISDAIEGIINGSIKHLIINVSPGSSKTELVVVNLIARGLALNPRSRFLHVTGSDSLASLNSSTARDLIASEAYQALWPMKIAPDAKAKKQWNVVLENGQLGGGVYATALGGQITGFRAGHMTPEWCGAVICDDLSKPEDAHSKSKLDASNRKLINTVFSRTALPGTTPIILIMQRVAENDPTGFLMNNSDGKVWKQIVLPAVINDAYVETLEPKYRDELIRTMGPRIDGRFSYWPFKEPLERLLAMEKGGGIDETGNRVSRHVFNSQYQQAPVTLGGNIIKGEWFKRYTILPKLKYRKIFADTATKTASVNDYSVFACYGLGEDGKMYLVDQIRGRWEIPELRKRASAFWNKHKAMDTDKFGSLREMIVEDASSGSTLIQDIRYESRIPIKGLIRVKDKVTRLMDVISYFEAGMVCVPDDAPFVNDFIAELEAFTNDNSHPFDDQADCAIDAALELLSRANVLKQWASLA